MSVEQNAVVETTTELVAQTTQWWTQHQDKLIDYAVNLTAAIIIVVIGLWVASAVSSGIRKLMNKRALDPTISSFVSVLVKYAIVAFVIVAALSRVGVQTASFVAIIGAAGLAVGLALQGSLSNFAAGVLLIAFRPFKAGEFVEVAGTAGVIDSVQLFSSVLTTPDNKVVTVPNSAILNGNIVNYSRMPTRRVDLVVGVSYKADLKKAKEVIEGVLQADSRVLKDPAYTVAVLTLNSSSVDLVVRPWVNGADYWPVYFALTENIKLALDANGIEIPFPQMDVHLHKEQA